MSLCWIVCPLFYSCYIWFRAACFGHKPYRRGAGGALPRLPVIPLPVVAACSCCCDTGASPPQRRQQPPPGAASLKIPKLYVGAVTLFLYRDGRRRWRNEKREVSPVPVMMPERALPRDLVQPPPLVTNIIFWRGGCCRLPPSSKKGNKTVNSSVCGQLIFNKRWVNLSSQ